MQDNIFDIKIGSLQKVQNKFFQVSILILVQTGFYIAGEQHTGSQNILYLICEVIIHIIQACTLYIAFTECSQHTTIIDCVAGNHVLAFLRQFQIATKVYGRGVCFRIIAATIQFGRTNRVIYYQRLGIDVFSIQFKSEDELRLIDVETH